MEPEEAIVGPTPVPELVQPGNRLTVVELVYHQTLGEQPVCVESRFVRSLASSEQLYQRRKAATVAWQPLDFGWVDDPGTIVICNTEGLPYQQLRTLEQRQAMEEKFLEVTYDGCPQELTFIIRAGESMRLHPSKPLRLQLRSPVEGVRYTITAIPA